MKYLYKYNEANVNDPSYTKKIDDVLSELPTLKDLKDVGLIYTVKSIKDYLKPENKWKEEFMPFPENLIILNVLIGSKLGKSHFIKCQKERGDSTWRWQSKIKLSDIHSFPIPQKIYDSIVK